MTKKDYIIIARVLRESLAAASDDSAKDSVRWVTLRFADTLMAENPRFDLMRFVTAASNGDRSI